MDTKTLKAKLSSEAIELIPQILSYGHTIDDLLDAIIYYHNNDLFGKDVYGKPFTINQMIIGLNTIKALEMLYDILDGIVWRHKNHLATINDEELKSIENTIESTLRSFFGYVQRFAKI